MTDPKPPVDGLPASSPKEDRKPAQHVIGWLGIAIAAVFGLLYAYDLWEAVGNIVGVPQKYEAVGFQVRTPWVLLVVGLFIPVVTYLAAVLLGLRRNVGARALLLLTGFLVCNGLSLALVAVEFRIYSDIIHDLAL